MARRRPKIDVVALVPDCDAIRAWFADTGSTEREASISAARKQFWDLCSATIRVRTRDNQDEDREGLRQRRA